MSDIPKARKSLSAIAEQLDNLGLNHIAKQIKNTIKHQLHRRKAVRRMSVSSRPIDEDAIEEIKELARKTDMHSSEIAAEVGVNPGRVSEVLQGDR